MNERPGVSRKRRGIVLIVVLVIVTMIALAGFGFVNSMNVEYHAVRIQGDSLQATQTLASAETFVAAFLEQPRAERELAGGSFDNPTRFRNVLTIGPIEENGDTLSTPRFPSSEPAPLMASSGQPSVSNSLESWRFSVFSPADVDPLRQEEFVTPFRFGLTDESSRLNLHALLVWERTEPGSAARALLNIPGMTPEVADALLDWIDSDDQRREFGAEAEYYATAAQPIQIANTIPASLDELRFVRGVTRQLVAGDGAAAPAVRSASSWSPSLDPAGPQLPPWRDLLTIHSAERNVDRSGRPRVHLNHPSLPTVRAELSTVLPADVVDFIILFRQFGPAASSGDVVPPSSVTVNDSQPPQFTFSSVVDLIDSAVQVPAEDSARTVASPLRSGDETLVEVLPTLLDVGSLTTDPVLRGRINILHASEAVLRTLPPLTEETVSRILAERAQLDPASRSSVAWLLTQEIVSKDVFRQLLPWITSGGDVFRCQIVVSGPNGGPFRRTETVFDATTSPPQRLRSVDLTHLGTEGTPDLSRGLQQSPVRSSGDSRLGTDL